MRRFLQYHAWQVSPKLLKRMKQRGRQEKPGFNSGRFQLMGPLSRNAGVTTTQLVNYPGSHYANPIFSWKDPIAVSAIEFMKSSVLGQRYKNNIFIGDYNNGNLYYFEVNNTRTGIKLDPTEQQVFGLSDIEPIP